MIRAWSIRRTSCRPCHSGGRGCAASQRSNCAAKAWRSRACRADGPPVAMPAPRNSSMKPRTDSRSLMVLLVNGSPRGPTAVAPASSTRAASGMSWVTTRSPAATRSAIASSAASGPPGTWMARTWGQGGRAERVVGDQGQGGAGARGGAEQDVADHRRAGVGIDPDLCRLGGVKRFHLVIFDGESPDRQSDLA